MKASYQWLRALLPELTDPPREVAERLTRAGLEVEQIVPFGQGLEPVLVATVRKVEPHPTRSGLRLVTVDRGEGHEQRIVCGAPNVPEPGGAVVLAPLGTHLPAKDLTLTSREIGGVISEGMLCSEEELGLTLPGSESKALGILVLSSSVVPGTPFLRACPHASDTIFELGVTPNRPDALGHLGIARDLAALYGFTFQAPLPLSPPRVAKGELRDRLSVEVHDFERCPHYGAAAVVSVKVGPSPAWLRYRLSSLGVRPISNVVDVTNLVMFEFGHPLHAFDLDRVRGSKILVRRAQAGEKLTTIDGIERSLELDDLLIADAERALALAGVMGGRDSEITEGTQRILVECAYFQPSGVRRSARRHGLHTEASHRFERGVDPGDVPDVLAHAASLIADLASGEAVPGTLHALERAKEGKRLTLRSGRLDALLGVSVPFDEAKGVLERLGFSVTERPAASEGSLANEGPIADVVVPTFRPDIYGEADLIEEVARIRGLDRIPTRLPSIRPQPPRPAGKLLSQVRATAVELGLSEAVTYGFVSPSDLEKLHAPAACVRLTNPLSEERSVMRTSLLAGLLEAVGHAFRHGEEHARLFTVGSVFLPGTGPLPEERPSLAIVLAGHRPMYLHKAEPYDVYDAKGLAQDLLLRVRGLEATITNQAPAQRSPHLHPRAAAQIEAGGVPVGRLGMLHPDVLAAFDLAHRAVSIVELDLSALGTVPVRPRAYTPIARVPATTRDLALVVHDDIAAGQVSRRLREVAGDLCERIELFDLFRGGQVPGEHRSLAFRLVYRDPRAMTAPETARTLTDQEVDQRHAQVVAAAQSTFNASLRQ